MHVSVLTPAATPREVLPGLASIGVESRSVRWRLAAVGELGDAEVVIIDARTDLHTARRLCNALAGTPRRAVVVVVDEGSMICLGETFRPHQFLLPSATPAEIRARLAMACSTTRPTRARDRVRRVGRLEFDRNIRHVTFDGRPLRLGPQEYAALFELARPPLGRVISRAELLDSTHGSPWFDPSALDPIIKQLRLMLGDHMVEAVRGVGYRLNPTRLLSTA